MTCTRGESRCSVSGIKEIRLGNKKINKYLISHDDLIKAGEITFIVTENPNKK